jgi:plasmid stabilization system protein ParE
MVKIVFSASARLDLKEIIDYIKRDSEYYATLEKVRIIAAIDKIPLQIFAGRIAPELDNPKIREVIFRNYRIIYDVVSDKQINILSIHHHSRLIGNNPAFNSAE